MRRGRKRIKSRRAWVVSEFEDLLCVLCVPQRSLRLNLPFNAENTENAEDAEETLQLKTPLAPEYSSSAPPVARLIIKLHAPHCFNTYAG